MSDPEELIAKFFEEYKIAVHPREFNRYLLSIGEGAMPEGTFARVLNSVRWTDVVLALYRRSKKSNPFIDTSVGTRKSFEMPYYTKHAFFCFPKGHEEYLWARFIFMPFSSPERTALWTKSGKWDKGGESESGRRALLQTGAPVFIIKMLYEEKNNMTVVELAKKLKYKESTSKHPGRNFFEPNMQHLVGKFVLGSGRYAASNEYTLTMLSQKSCALAFSGEWQKKYFELERNKVFAWRL